MEDALLPLWSFFTRHAYGFVFVVTAIDATGTPFPGRLLLIAAGAFAATGGANALLIILLGAAGAVLGDHVWYLAGWFGGQRLMALYCRLTLSSPDCVQNANRYFERFGGLAILLARFSTAVRIVVTPLAASSGIPYRTYLTFDVIGALLWVSVFVMLGYSLREHGTAMVARSGATKVSLIALALGIGWVGAVVSYRLWKRVRAGSARLG